MNFNRYSIKLSYFFVYALLVVAALVIFVHKVHPVKPANPLSDLPGIIGQWKLVKTEVLDQDTMNMLRPTDYLLRQYSGKGGENVWLYVVYYDGGEGKVGIHSPLLCFTGNGWMEDSRDNSVLNVEGENIKYRELVYDKDQEKEYVMYWYQVKDGVTPDEYLLKLLATKNSILQKRRDQALVRVTVRVDSDVQRARAVARTFLTDIHKELATYLPN